jgi:putative membrane protein
VATVVSEIGAADFQPPLRLHRSSWVFALSGSLQQFIVPLIALLVFGSRRDDDWFGTPLVLTMVTGAMLLRALWHQWTYRYGFGPRGLVIREGLIFRNVRLIEYPRIENIDTERGPLHRLLNVAQVRVQTSTGGKPEALISVLGMGALQEMRELVFADTRAPAKTAEETRDPPLLHLKTMDLVRHGLTDNRGMFFVAAGTGLLHQAGFFRVDDEDIDHWIHSVPLSDIAGLGIAMQVALALFVIVMALVVVRILSVILALVTLHDFTLTRHEGDLRVRHGLLTSIALTLRTGRIQAVNQKESPLHRLFGAVSLDVDLAGDSGDEGNQRNPERMKTRWLAPVCSIAAAPGLIASALPGFDPCAPADWQPLAPDARSRIFRRSALLSVLIVAGPGLWYLRADAAFCLPLLVGLAWMHAHLYVKHTRWALEQDVLMFRSGWLTRRLTIVPRDRVQSVDVSESPFDRRRRMASLSVDTAGGSTRSARVHIRYLPVDVAQGLAATLYRQSPVSP